MKNMKLRKKCTLTIAFMVVSSLSYGQLSLPTMPDFGSMGGDLALPGLDTGSLGMGADDPLGGLGFGPTPISESSFSGITGLEPEEVLADATAGDTAFTGSITKTFTAFAEPAFTQAMIDFLPVKGGEAATALGGLISLGNNSLEPVTFVGYPFIKEGGLIAYGLIFGAGFTAMGATLGAL